MSDSVIGLPVLIGCFFVALVLGIAAHKTHFCTMGGISDWVNMGLKDRLGAWLLAIATALTGVLLLDFPRGSPITRSGKEYLRACAATRFSWKLADGVQPGPDRVHRAVVGIRRAVGKRAEVVDCDFRDDLVEDLGATHRVLMGNDRRR